MNKRLHNILPWKLGLYCSNKKQALLNRMPVLTAKLHLFMAIALILCGDIECNPGPTSENQPENDQTYITGLCLNARSLKNKLWEFNTMIADETIKLIGVTETWLYTDIPDGAISTKHIIFRKDRNSHGGGVLLAISPELLPQQINDPSFENTESVWASFHTKQKRWLCGVFYRPPNDNTSVAQLEEILLQLDISRYDGILLMGDFNINWSLNNTSQQLSSLRNWTSSLGLDQLVNIPTRFAMDGNSGTVLDLLFTNKAANISDVTVNDPLSTSDHCTLHFRIHGDYIQSTFPPRTKYKYDKADKILLASLLEEVSWDNIEAENIEETWENFLNIFMTCFNESVPRQVHNKKPKPWISPDIKKLTSLKRKLFKRARKTNDLQHWDAYKKIRNTVKYASKNSQQSFLFNLLSKPDNTKSFWSYVRSKKKSVPNHLFEVDGNICSNPGQIAEAFNHVFASNFTNHESQNETITSPEIDIPPFELIQVTALDVYKKLSKLKGNKAAGPDGITPMMLKIAAKPISGLLAEFYNYSLQKGELPSSWKQANIVPVFKKGQKQQLKNYRPIALTSLFCKTLESIIVERISTHLNDYGLLYEKQHGFCSQRSCETLLAEATSKWTIALDKPSSQIDVISLDYSRAFDSISHHILIKKLELSYGINGPLLSWLKCFLTNRTQRTIYHGEYSKWTKVLSGVPQGSVAGPLMFNIYMNDLHLHLSTKPHQYADDTFIFRPINSVEDSNCLQDDLNSITEWSNTNMLSLNPDKCQVLSLTRKRNPTAPVYKIRDKELECVPHLKLLGVHISSDLTWDFHVAKISARCNKTIGFIRAISGQICPTVILLKLYKALVLPLLMYCCTVWYPYREKHKFTLEQIQRRATRMILHQRRLEQPYEQRLLRLKLMDLNSLRDYISILFVCKEFNNMNNRYLLELISINHRHQEILTFKRLKARTDSALHCIPVRFCRLWDALPTDLRNDFILLKWNTFKNNLRKQYLTVD